LIETKTLQSTSTKCIELLKAFLSP